MHCIISGVLMQPLLSLMFLSVLIKIIFRCAGESSDGVVLGLQIPIKEFWCQWSVSYW